MKILEINTNTQDYRELILELISKIDKVEQSPEELNIWLTLGLGTDIFGAWIAVDGDEEPVGVLTCEVVEQNIEPKVFISFCYVKPKCECVNDLLAKCEEWAKSKNIKKLLFYTKRNCRAFTKKYGFKIEKSILIKELK